MIELVVMGGSAGSLPALQRLLDGLPVPPRTALVVVLHQHHRGGGQLHVVLARWTKIPICVVEDKTPIATAFLHVCPPNYHTLVESGRTFALSTDDRVSYARPSIDVLFESAARVYRKQLVGVLLSGTGSDGVNGLEMVRRFGGLSICQDPATAEAPRLPQNARDAGIVDWLGSPEAIGARLEELWS